jgi:hypothetical protein
MMILFICYWSIAPCNGPVDQYLQKHERQFRNKYCAKCDVLSRSRNQYCKCGDNVYDSRRRNDQIKVTGCIRVSNGGESKSTSLTFQAGQSKTTKQLVFDGSVDNPNSHPFGEKTFDQLAKKIPRDGGGIIFPDPVDKPFDKVDVSDKEREERNELLNKNIWL